MTIKFTTLRPGLIKVSYINANNEVIDPCIITKCTDKLWRTLQWLPEKDTNIDALQNAVDSDYKVVKQKVIDVLTAKIPSMQERSSKTSTVKGV